MSTALRLSLLALLLCTPQSSATAQSPSFRLAADRVSRFEGHAVVNGSARGTIALDVIVANPASQRIVAVLTAADGLVGQGVLEGTLSAGTLRLKGVVRYDVPTEGGVSARGAWEVDLTGRVAQGGRIAGRYHLTGIGAGGEQDAEFDVTLRTQRALTPPARALVGRWNVVVGSSAYVRETDDGMRVRRTLHTTVGAPAGKLTVSAAGRFSWQTPDGPIAGAMLPYRPLAGGTAWIVYDRSRVYYAFTMPREANTLYLFSPADESERLRAKRGS